MNVSTYLLDIHVYLHPLVLSFALTRAGCVRVLVHSLKTGTTATITMYSYITYMTVPAQSIAPDDVSTAAAACTEPASASHPSNGPIPSLAAYGSRTCMDCLSLVGTCRYR